MYDLIRPLVADVTVCDPRENKLLQSGNKDDEIDVDKLARLLRLGEMQPHFSEVTAALLFSLTVSTVSMLPEAQNR